MIYSAYPQPVRPETIVCSNATKEEAVCVSLNSLECLKAVQ